MKSKAVNSLSLLAYFLVIIGMTFIVFNSIILLRTHEQIPVQDSTDNPSFDKKDLPLKEGEWFGVLIAPSQNKKVPIYEGTSSDILSKGAGHYSASASPEDSDNTIISGHRDTYFRFLKDVSKNDKIIIQTKKGIFTYRIRKTDIVSASADNILTPKSRPILTLTTCFPFSYIGDAPDRYILTADLIKQEINK
ncbi:MULTISPECIES: class D sortase [unclassified Niallia]|uniref:class D sortase n=1 Tax=Niallia TaxID=2837506 RepID=UPI001EDC8A00|nr:MULTISPECIES: class D sortase [unclassified Niallia]MDL0436349.1 class D sortase [Niallia sp. SS-2023]UPO89251.1 class D sortase [Niallia sp. Man26]